MKLKIKKGLIASAACLATSIGASLAMSANAPVFAGSAPSNCSDIKPAFKKESSTIAVVNTDNYAFAETEVILGDYVEKIAKATCSDGMGVFMHLRKAMDPKDKTILRANFDTLYSMAVLDLTSPATITLPASGRLQILEVISSDSWIPLESSKPGGYEITKEMVGSRFAYVIIRTQVNMQDPADIKRVGVIQDKIDISQESRGEFVQTKNWDRDQMLRMRSDYQKEKEAKGINPEDLFGKKGEISSEMRNMGVAFGWGALTKKGAVYPSIAIPGSGEGLTLTLKDVPMADNAFWSVTVYDKDGFAQGDNYNINSSFAKKDDKGSYVLNFGKDSTKENFLEIYPGSNATLRIYSPQEAYFDGSWKVPEIQSSISVN